MNNFITITFTIINSINMFMIYKLIKNQISIINKLEQLDNKLSINNNKTNISNQTQLLINEELSLEELSTHSNVSNEDIDLLDNLNIRSNSVPVDIKNKWIHLTNLLLLNSSMDVIHNIND